MTGYVFVPFGQGSPDGDQHSSRVDRPPSPPAGLPSRVLTASQTIVEIDRFYPVDLTAGPLTFWLPASSDLSDGVFVAFIDLLGLANVDNITVIAAQGDQINDQGVLNTQHVIKWASTITMYFLHQGVWRPYQNGA